MRLPSRPWLSSVLLHVVILGLILAGGGFLHSRVSPPKPVDAVVVDEALIEAAAQAKRERRAAARSAIADREGQEQLRQQREREALAAEERRLESERLEQQRAREEVERVAAAKKQAEADAVARRDAERVRAEAAARSEAERARAEQRARAEAARAAAERRAQEQREAELKASLAAEEEARGKAGAVSAQRDVYSKLVSARIEQSWLRPPSARAGLDCTVYVTQVPGGEVVDARVASCNGDEAVRESIRAAVWRASPLPPPPSPELFERNLVIRFVPGD